MQSKGKLEDKTRGTQKEQQKQQQLKVPGNYDISN